MPLGNFPQLQGLLQRKQGQGQVMPATPTTQFVPAGQQAGAQDTNQYSQVAGLSGDYTQPKQGKFDGQMGQQLFNQEQENANKGIAGGKFNRRRY